MSDIANRLGVSKTTASLALRNDPRISEKRRAEVHRVAAEMGYTPDPFLAGLAAYRQRRAEPVFKGVIAWINRWNPPERLRELHEFDAYWVGAAEAARRLGYQLEEIRWPSEWTGARMQEEMIKRGVMGILIPPHPAGLNWEDLDWKRYSLVRFGMSVRKPDTNLVTSDHHRSMLMAMQKIHEYGYRRIGLVLSEAHDHLMGGNYMGGYLWAQQQLNLDPVLPPLKMELGSTPQEISKYKAAIKDWMTKWKPDAVFTHESSFPGFLKELGYRIPQDVAVAGTSIYDIGLDTGIDQHSDAIGRIAAEMLIKQITMNERGEPEDPCRILVESRWKDGNSLPRKLG